MNDDKKMYSGDWKCSGCGASITELPFEPKNTSNLNCRDCFMKNRPAGGGGERKMFSGDWKCGKCQAPITELPFEPDPARADQLTCRDCYSKR